MPPPRKAEATSQRVIGTWLWIRDTFTLRYDRWSQAAGERRPAGSRWLPRSGVRRVYDSARRLAYRGAFDQSTPGNGKPVTGELLRAAIELTLAGQPLPEPHRPSMAAQSNGGPGHPHDRHSPSPGR